MRADIAGISCAYRNAEGGSLTYSGYAQVRLGVPAAQVWLPRTVTAAECCVCRWRAIPVRRLQAFSCPASTSKPLSVLPCTQLYDLMPLMTALQVKWETSPACHGEATLINSMADAESRLWGWDEATGNSCKFVDTHGKAVKHDNMLQAVIAMAAAESTELKP